jgi:hypothetical protein
VILAAAASALLMIERLKLCRALAGDGPCEDGEDWDLDKRIARGDRLVAYDVITSCIDDLEAFRNQLGETLLGAEAMARLAALAAKKGAQRSC